MKTIQLFVQFLFGSHTEPKSQPIPIVEKTSDLPATESPEPERLPLPDDDSPPGYKVRWHH